ncbi:hypothetical protein BX600DRAFT_454512 [Xylariales sp. PMI_506]|nr:hypothetical protein BX600DRAFT_454512 [Xylariales sp. PMI_506]
MSFSVALQSAIFYICACTPCTKAREHRQSKKQAIKDREEKLRLQAEMPHLYQHPDPFNTNPYWKEEIMMGPSLPRKKTSGASKNTSQRALNSAGRESKESQSVSASSIAIGSSPTVLPEDGELDLSTSMSISQTYSDDWNKKRYQREDEELWGRELSLAGHKLMDAIKQAGSSAGRIIEAKLGMEKPVTEEDRNNFYSTIKNPPVNDYHPPVVSQRPKDKDAAKWMLQPPPPAKVMEGKVPVSRSTSIASVASRRTMASSVAVGDGSVLGRQVHEKLLSAKLRNGEAPAEVEFSPSKRRPSTVGRRNTTSSRGGMSQRSNRSRSLSLESSEASDDFKRRRRPRARPPMTPEIDSSSDDDYMRGSLDSLGVMPRAAQRPKLQTIRSSQVSDIQPERPRDKSPKKSATQTTQPSPLQDITNQLSQPKTEPVTEAVKQTQGDEQEKPPQSAEISA